MERLVSDIPAGNGKIATLFLQCAYIIAYMYPWLPKSLSCYIDLQPRKITRPLIVNFSNSM
jgi:hypothetical protein